MCFALFIWQMCLILDFFHCTVHYLAQKQKNILEMPGMYKSLSSSQWLPESARYDVLTGNSRKALTTLHRIAEDNGTVLPKGRLIADRQVRVIFFTFMNRTVFNY